MTSPARTIAIGDVHSCSAALDAILGAIDPRPNDTRKIPGPHLSGKTVITGHTAQRDGALLDLGYLKCIDTKCYSGGYLTALDVTSGELWQANERGEMRRQ